MVATLATSTPPPAPSHKPTSTSPLMAAIQIPLCLTASSPTTSTPSSRSASPHLLLRSNNNSATSLNALAAGMLGFATLLPGEEEDGDIGDDEENDGTSSSASSSSSSTSSSPCSTPPSYQQATTFGGRRADASTPTSLAPAATDSSNAHDCLSNQSVTSLSTATRLLQRPSAFCKAPSASSLKHGTPSSSSSTASLLAAKKKSVSFAQIEDICSYRPFSDGEDSTSDDEDDDEEEADVEYVSPGRGAKPVRQSSSYNWKKWDLSAGSAVFELNMSNDELMRRD